LLEPSLESQVEKESKVLVAVRPPDSPQEKKRRGLQVNLKWLGVSLSVTMADILAFLLFASAKNISPSEMPKPEVSVHEDRVTSSFS